MRSRSNEMNKSQRPGVTPQRAYTGYVIALLAVVYAFNHMDRTALAVLMPLIKQDLVLSDAQIGLMVGLAFSFFFAVCGIPIARWADRGIRRNIIAMALMTWSGMTALSGAVQNSWQLFLARVGVGVGEAGCLPPSQSLLCDYVTERKRPGAFAFNMLGLYAGVALGMVLGGWLGETIGWRWTFVALGVPGLALAAIVRFTLREPRRGALDGSGGNEPSLPFSETLKVLWNCRVYRYILVFVVVNGFVIFGLTQWWPSFYSRLFGLSVAAAGGYLGFALAGGSVIGVLTGGLLANKLSQRHIGLPLTISAMAVIGALPMALGSLLSPSFTKSITFTAFTVLLLSVSNGPVTAALYSSVAAGMRATAGAMAAFCVAIIGSSLGPLCIGVASDLLRPALGIEALRYAMVVPLVLLPLQAFVLFVVGKRMNLDSRHYAALARPLA